MVMNINETIESAVVGLGYELVDVEFTPNGMIRVFIDKDGGVTVDDCEITSDHLSRLLVVEDVDYTRLEISSPGLDRPLKKFSDYIRFVGKDVKVKTNKLINDEKVFYGVIVSANEVNQDITLKLDGLSHKKSILLINYGDISKSRLVFNYQKSLKHDKVKKTK